MFHAHQSEFTQLGWMGFFEVVDVMEARERRRRSGLADRRRGALPGVAARR